MHAVRLPRSFYTVEEWFPSSYSNLTAGVLGVEVGWGEE